MTADSGAWHSTVQRRLLEVEAILHSYAAGDVRKRVYAHLLDTRAKRLRPAFVLLAAGFGCDAVDDDPLCRAAAAVEIVHEATLYHDDVVDEAVQRRGLPSVYHQLGARVAADVGSELLYAAAGLCADLPRPIRVRIATTAAALARAQRQEVASAGTFDVEPLTRLRIMHGKTASLFQLAAYTGATLARADPAVNAELLRFAARFGLCYQLADDLADLFADEQTLGRAPGSDLLDGIATLPVLAALSALAGDPGLRPLIAAVFDQRHDSSLLGEAIARLRESAAVGAMCRTLDRWLRATAAVVPPATGTTSAPAASSLRRLCDDVRERSARALDRAAPLPLGARDEVAGETSS